MRYWHRIKHHGHANLMGRIKRAAKTPAKNKDFQGFKSRVEAEIARARAVEREDTGVMGALRIIERALRVA